MGWLKLGGRNCVSEQSPKTFQENLKAITQHLETISIDPKYLVPSKTYDFVETSVPDSRLPFIPAEEVIKRKSKETGGLFIVVDGIVYDCTEFISDHPGGEQIIRSFGGAECSWQFWRFYGRKEMEESGKQLRVGRTEGLVNRFKEPVRYVGLRRLGNDDW